MNMSEQPSPYNLENEFEARIVPSVVQDLQEYSITPIEVIKGVESIDNLRQGKVGIDEELYCVALVRLDGVENESLAIYKAFVNEGPLPNAAEHEILFLEVIYPSLEGRLSSTVQSKIRVPKVYASNLERKSIVQEYCDGAIAGSVHMIDTVDLGNDDVELIAEFISGIKLINIDELQESYPELRLISLKEIEVLGDKYKYDLQKREEVLIEVLGQSNFDQLAHNLASFEVEEMFEKQVMGFTAYDIQPANIIINDDLVSLIDWERLCKSNNPAMDYVFLFATLWSRPELQAVYFKKVMELNEFDAEFAELFRMDYLYNRGSGELVYWHNQLTSETSDISTEICIAAIEHTKGAIIDALNHRGLWQQLLR